MDPLGTLKVQNQMLIPHVRSWDFEWYISPSNLFLHLSIRDYQASLSYLVMLRNTGENARGQWAVKGWHPPWRYAFPNSIIFPRVSGPQAQLVIFLLGWQMKAGTGSWNHSKSKMWFFSLTLVCLLHSVPCKRCVVVGNGGVLKNKTLGEKIDSYDVIIR